MEQPQTNPTPREGIVASVLPTRSAAVRLRPIGMTESVITGGLWADRRATNHTSSMRHAAEQLERAGNLTNMRLAAGAAGAYAGSRDDSGTTAPFLDSDIHKWLEAVGWELAQVPDASLQALADPVIDLIGRAQRSDGYIDTFFQVARPGREFTDLEWGHELYVAGHMAQAAIAWHRGLGDDRLLRITERFVERIWQELGPGRRELVDGHPEIEMALVELYRTTGQARYLELAALLVERRGRGLLGNGRFGDRYWQDHEPVRSAREPVGHAVRQVYLDCGVVDLAIETGDQELLGSAIRRWEALVGSRMYLTGALGSRHSGEAIGAPFELPPDRAYAETCASIGSTMLAWRLLLATGEERFADLIERTSYNSILAGLGADGCHFFYSNPLQRRSAGLEVTEGAASTRRSSWFEVSCCPPNIMRSLATLPERVALIDQDGLRMEQYVTGTLRAAVPGGNVSLRTSTRYPWSGEVDIEVLEAPVQPWRLGLRIPAWCSKASVAVGEGPVEDLDGPGSVDLFRAWSAGDRVALRLRMEPRVSEPDRRIDALRHTVALERGPLVYAVEDADLPHGASVERLEVDPELDVTAIEAPVPGADEATRLTFDAWLREDPAEVAWPYRDRAVGRATAGPDDAAAGPDAGGPVPVREAVTSEKVHVEAVPYFAWAERPGLGMRVWLPLAAGDTGAEHPGRGS